MNVLIVGAGAVGSIYGAALAKAGDDVTFWVRPKYEQDLEKGIYINEVGIFGGQKSFLFDQFSLATNATSVSKTPDEIWLCVSKPAVKKPWVEELADAFPDAEFVSFQPGLFDFSQLSDRVPDRVNNGGVIGVVSYQPHGPNGHDDMTVFHPPGSPTMMFGPKAEEISERLNRGGCPAKVEQDALKIAPQMSVVLMTFVVALEIGDWSLEKFLSTPELRELWESSATQAMDAVCQELNADKIGAAKLITARRAFSAALKVIPKVAPFDVEAYLKYHFTKVRTQSMQMIQEYIDVANKHGLPNDALQQLLKKAQQ